MTRLDLFPDNSLTVNKIPNISLTCFKFPGLPDKWSPSISGAECVWISQPHPMLLMQLQNQPFQSPWYASKLPCQVTSVGSMPRTAADRSLTRYSTCGHH